MKRVYILIFNLVICTLLFSSEYKLFKSNFISKTNYASKKGNVGEFQLLSDDGKIYIEEDDLKKLLKSIYPFMKFGYSEEKKAMIFAENEYNKNYLAVVYYLNKDLAAVINSKNLKLDEFGLKLIRKDEKLYYPLITISDLFFDFEIQFLYNGSEYIIVDQVSLREMIKDPEYQKSSKNEVLSNDLKRTTSLYFFSILNEYYVNDKFEKEFKEKSIESFVDKGLKESSNTNFYSFLQGSLYSNNDYHSTFIKTGYKMDNLITITDYDNALIAKAKKFEFKLKDEKIYLYYRSELNLERIQIFKTKGINIYETKEYNNFVKQKNNQNLQVFLNRVMSTNIADYEFLTNTNKKTFSDYSEVEKYFKKQLNLNKYFKQSKISYKILDEDTAYLKIPSFYTKKYYFNESVREVFKKIKNYKNLIIDIRNNQGGYLENMAYFSNFLIKEKSIEIFEKINEEIKLYKKIVKTEDSFKGEIYLLINNETYSAANNLAAIFKTYKIGKILGKKSYGGSYSPFLFVLPDNSTLSLSRNLEITDIEGTDFNGGIIPDFEIDDFEFGQEKNLLNKTLEIIKKEH